MKTTLSAIVCAMAITAFGCGNGGGGDGGGDSDAGGDDGGGGVELCMDNPAEACAGECAFEPPADVNCSNACANIDTVCGFEKFIIGQKILVRGKISSKEERTELENYHGRTEKSQNTLTPWHAPLARQADWQHTFD